MLSPNSWRERFIGAGHSNLTMSMAELIRYFRLQENLAIKKMAENSTRQKTNMSNINNNNRRRNKRGAPKEQKSKEDFKIPRKMNNNKNKNKTTGKHRLEDNDPCPVHVSGTHTWGECIENAFNKKRRTEYYHKNKSSDNKKNKTSDSENHHIDVTTEPEEKANTSDDELMEECSIHSDDINGKHFLDCMIFENHLCFTNNINISLIDHQNELDIVKFNYIVS